MEESATLTQGAVATAPAGGDGGCSRSGRSAAVSVWLELKSRRGFASTKQRSNLIVPAEALSFGALARGVVPSRTLTEVIAGFGFFPRGHLRPVVAISYRRYRFVEPRTGFRISIDSRIRSSTVLRPASGSVREGWSCPVPWWKSKDPSSTFRAYYARLLRSVRHGPGTPSTPRVSKLTSPADGRVKTVAVWNDRDGAVSSQVRVPVDSSRPLGSPSRTRPLRTANGIGRLEMREEMRRSGRVCNRRWG